ncbi:Sec9p [Sugiyamaella lignohabitans]|uniref:Sec9p n=1 Tax=Sugiyamaella lignohabitans TaxID=796027 RepID=A0A167E1F7_9ASCO|nr:Sec9p [Sugiyamaella lignohabitans]ANB13533.1 Sec9p [Sugiyamaella lignohabitans]
MKKLFGKKDKEMTPEQHREFLESHGITVSGGNKRATKFDQFSAYAQKVTQSRNTPLGPNSFKNAENSDPAFTSETGGSHSSNPYATGSSSSNPYANASVNYNKSVPSGTGNAAQRPYGGNYGNYGNNRQNNSAPVLDSKSQYGTASTSQSSSPYASAETSYSNRFGAGNGAPLTRTETTDTTAEARAKLFQGASTQAGAFAGRSSMGNSNSAAKKPISAEDELFELPSELDQNAPPSQNGYGQEQQQELDSEDEDVEAIKGQIRFTKKESVQSTRNALRMAAEAEESGRNTLGMLGSQGERIANTERTLALAETQNKIAEEKARELKIANRPLYVPHMSNPFNAKRRLQEQEAKIKAEHMFEQRNREGRRQMAYDSQQRIIKGLNGDNMSETAQKYRNQKFASSAERQKYQFEGDSEDEDLENEIDSNLDGLSSAASRLNKLALATNEEITRQNERLDRIADQTDMLDVNVHLNTSRLQNIK